MGASETERHGDRRRVRALLLAVFVPVVVLVGGLASVVLGGDSRATGAPPRPVAVPSALAAEYVPPHADRIDVGSGPRAAAIFRPEGGADIPGPVVVFLHGWAALDPARYGPWIAHLVAEGVTVIYPAYQVHPARDTVTPLGNAIAAVRAALADVRLAPGRLVFAGHSAGGALAADLAAVAAQFRLPEPAAVFSVYPGRKLSYLPVPMPTVDLALIPKGVRVLALGGARDTAVGTEPAREIVAGAREARARFKLIHDDAVDEHSAPRGDGPDARRTFWAPLDRLIDATASSAAAS